MPSAIPFSTVNRYLAHKQHLLASSPAAGVMACVRDIVALHSTNVTGPYLSLWARLPRFERPMLDALLYEERTVARVMCMRMTVHIVPTGEVPIFIQAWLERNRPRELRESCELLVQGGICRPEEAEARLLALHAEVMRLLERSGPATQQEISRRIPALQAKIPYAANLAYTGAFSLGSRLIGSMCTLGLLLRARPRGTWQSALFEYDTLAHWLPGVSLDTVTGPQARVEIVRRYLAAFGPVRREDVAWWTGFSQPETAAALASLAPDTTQVTLEDGAPYLMLAADAARMAGHSVESTPAVFLLPALDPYIMGYQQRGRFLPTEHYDKVFDRAGNAMPTVWAGCRVAGCWGQRADGRVVYRLFEHISSEESMALRQEIDRLEAFLGGERVAPRSQSPFYRTLAAGGHV